VSKVPPLSALARCTGGDVTQSDPFPGNDIRIGCSDASEARGRVGFPERRSLSNENRNPAPLSEVWATRMEV
jgi:hypothetical protein